MPLYRFIFSGGLNHALLVTTKGILWKDSMLSGTGKWSLWQMRWLKHNMQCMYDWFYVKWNALKGRWLMELCLFLNNWNFISLSMHGYGLWRYEAILLCLPLKVLSYTDTAKSDCSCRMEHVCLDSFSFLKVSLGRCSFQPSQNIWNSPGKNSLILSISYRPNQQNNIVTAGLTTSS